jgi:hypothetical protein
MPPRLNKRQLRELEELSALATSPDDIILDEEQEDESVFTDLQPNPPAGFAAVGSRGALLSMLEVLFLS